MEGNADVRSWVRLAADVLNEPDPAVAADRLRDARDPPDDEQLRRLVTGLHLHVNAVREVHSDLDGQPTVSLTPREQLILGFIANGGTASSAAARLGISERTVHKHRENLYRKLGAVDRLSAVLASQRLGFLPTPRTTDR